MTTVDAVLSRCQELGVTLTPTERGTLKVRAEAPLPEDLLNTLKHHKKEILAEVLGRAAVFREQAERFIRHGLALPILALPEQKGDEGCVSCGSPVDRGRFRCPVCSLAVGLALDLKP
ncbi:MAG: hypothetical protein ACE5MM_00920 [Nitrospiraceae bacterium]